MVAVRRVTFYDLLNAGVGSAVLPLQLLDGAAVRSSHRLTIGAGERNQDGDLHLAAVREGLQATLTERDGDVLGDPRRDEDRTRPQHRGLLRTGARDRGRTGADHSLVGAGRRDSGDHREAAICVLYGARLAGHRQLRRGGPERNRDADAAHEDCGDYQGERKSPAFLTEPRDHISLYVRGGQKDCRHVLLAVLRGGFLQLRADRVEHRQVEIVALRRLEHQAGVLGGELELEGRLETAP